MAPLGSVFYDELGGEVVLRAMPLMLVVALFFVWRSFYAMRIPQEPEKSGKSRGARQPAATH